MLPGRYRNCESSSSVISCSNKPDLCVECCGSGGAPGSVERCVRLPSFICPPFACSCTRLHGNRLPAANPSCIPPMFPVIGHTRRWISAEENGRLPTAISSIKRRPQMSQELKGQKAWFLRVNAAPVRTYSSLQ
jgi:hypothetical protein